MEDLAWQDLVRISNQNIHKGIETLKKGIQTAYSFIRFMPGYPLYNQEQAMIKKKETPIPGIATFMINGKEYQVTWCNEWVYWVLDFCGYDVSKIVRPAATHGKQSGIGYTNANEMVFYLEKNCRKLGIKEAVYLAQRGIAIPVGAAKPKGIGHVGILSPNSTVDNPMVDQSGAGEPEFKNGKWVVMPSKFGGGYGCHSLKESFNDQGLEPQFFYIPRRGKA